MREACGEAGEVEVRELDVDEGELVVEKGVVFALDELHGAVVAWFGFIEAEVHEGEYVDLGQLVALGSRGERFANGGGSFLCAAFRRRWVRRAG